MFAVHGEKLAAVFAHGLHQEFAAADDAFFVGEQEFLPRLCGFKARTHARGAHDGLNDGVDLRFSRNRRTGFVPGHHAHVVDAEFLEASDQSVVTGFIRNPDDVGTPNARKLREFLHIAARRQRKHAEAILIGRNHIQCAFSDGTCGAEHGNVSEIIHKTVKPTRNSRRYPFRLN